MFKHLKWSNNNPNAVSQVIKYDGQSSHYLLSYTNTFVIYLQPA